MTVLRVEFDAVGRDALPDLVDVVVEVGLKAFRVVIRSDRAN